MGYAVNVAISIPMAIIIYMLTTKVIINFTAENKYEDRIQKSFILGFIIGILYIVLGMTIFDENSNMYNQSLQLAMYEAGGFIVVNSVIFSWDDLDEGTKIVILAISMAGMIIYTYKNEKS